MSDDDVDRLSNLPDSLLSIIISSLPFQDAAKTSLLARRWLHLWHRTTNIVFDDVFFLPETDYDEEEKRNRRDNFVNFITQWIQRYEEPIASNFCLVFSQPKDYVTQMKHFIQFAIDHRVKFLTLDFSEPSWPQGSEMALHSTTNLQLPFYEDHESLEYLRLFSCYIDVKQFKNFSVLKTISLGWITLNDSSIQTLVSNCPMLEGLSLNNICQLEKVKIVASRLINLIIQNCSKPKSVYVDAPLLECFTYAGEFIEFHLVRLPSLVEANFDFGLMESFDETHGGDMHQMFNDISNIRYLSVCSYVLQATSFALEPFLLYPVLPHVQSLTLNTGLSNNECYGITFFLKHCSSLEELEIQIGDNGEIFEEYEPDDHPFCATYKSEVITAYECVMNTLKVVRIEGCKGKRNEALVIKYFLKYCAKLEKMHVGVLESKLKRITKKLKNYERASPNVVINMSTE